MSGFALTLHFVERGFEGEDSTNMDGFVFDHFVHHIDRKVVRMSVGEGNFKGRVHRGGGSQGDSELAYGAHGASRISSPEGFFPTVRATVVEEAFEASCVFEGFE